MSNMQENRKYNELIFYQFCSDDPSDQEENELPLLLGLMKWPFCKIVISNSIAINICYENSIFVNFILCKYSIYIIYLFNNKR